MARHRLNPPDRATLATLPPFAGLQPQQVSLPRTEAEHADARQALLACPHLGFDSESRPVFVRGQASNGPDVVQLASADHAWVLQLRHPPSEQLAREILTAPGIVKIGFDLRQDQDQLRQRLGIEAAPVLDLTHHFHGLGYPRTLGVRSAVAVMFGQHFSKSKKLTTTDWSAPQLSTRQLLYAANDAWAAMRVWLAVAGPQRPGG